MKKLLSRLRKALSFSLDSDDLEQKKIKVLYFIIILSTPLNLAFFVTHFSTQQYIYGSFNLLIIVMMLFTGLYIKRPNRDITVASHIIILAVFVGLVPAFFQEGIANSGFVWFFIFPLIAIFLVGEFTGKAWVGLLLTSTILVFIFSPYLSLPYDPVYLIFVIIALAVETFYFLFVLSIQNSYEKQLSLKNEKLQRLTHHLQDEVELQLNQSRITDALLSQQSKMASVGEMMSTISHQWKQPLGTINLLVENIKLAHELGDMEYDVCEKSLNEVIAQTTMMQNTMQDFLRFSRPNTKNKPFSANHAIQMMATLLESTLISKNITLTVNLPREELFIVGKENEFVHALMNMVNNAKDLFVERQISNPHIGVHLFVEKGKVILHISDNAGGMSKEVVNRVFDPYFSTKHKNGGTGLGLYLVSKIVREFMHGEIEVHNLHQGCYFKLSFDRVDDPQLTA